MNKKRLLPLFLALAMFLSTACVDKIPEPLVSKTPPPVTDTPPIREEYPVYFDDELFEAAPETVASLSPMVTEMLYDLGLGGYLVGVSDYCDRPGEKIGSPAKPDIDALTALAPELLITSSPIAATDILKLEQAGIRVLKVTIPNNYADLYSLYIKFSLIFTGMTTGTELANDVLKPLDDALIAAQRLGVSTEYVIVEAETDGGLMLSPSDTLCSDILSVFGTNIYTGDSYVVTDDELYYIAPKTVFYASGVDKDYVKKTFPHAQLIEIDFAAFERPSLAVMEVVSVCAGEIEK